MSKHRHVAQTTGSWKPSGLAPLTREETEAHGEEASSGSYEALIQFLTPSASQDVREGPGEIA